jgi:choline-sulfatase
MRLRYDLGGPEAVPPGEDRAIAVAWYGLDFLGLRRPDAEPRLDAERGLLFIPWGSEIDYYLRAPAGAVLRAAGRRSVAGDGRLLVYLDGDGADEQRLAAAGDGGELEIALPAAVSEPIRLSLAAVPAGPVGERGGLVVAKPAVWAPAAPAAGDAPAPPAGGGAPPNLIIYLVDTLRADRLGCYGHPRGVSPRIDRFAAGATLFENARANAPWTLPSVASVMTGLWPPAHGVFEDTRRLAPEAVTLAEVLRDAGYQTAAVVSNGFATGAYGLDQGFAEVTLIKTARRKSSHVHEAALAWLGSRDPERPFFLYLHTIDPHKPYLPTDELRRRFAPEAAPVWRQIVANPAKQRWPPSDFVIEQLQALYDAEIAENDASFGDTLDALEAAGLYDGSLIVFLSDHGEEFHEHSAWTHASNLFREVLNVPLIVKLPGQTEGRRVARLAQLIDLMPSLLAHLGIAGPAAVEGRLLPELLASSKTGPRRIFSHTKRKSQTTASVIDGDWKLIRRVDDKGITNRLYNWREDPHELTDRSADYPVLSGLLTVAIQRRLADSRPPGVADATPDEAVLDNLRDLGYVR